MLFSGSVFSLLDHHLRKWKTYHGRGLDMRFVVNRSFWENLKGNKRYFSKRVGAPICCSTANRSDSFLPSNEQLSDARLIYSVAPAMGHNQVYHGICS